MFTDYNAERRRWLKSGVCIRLYYWETQKGNEVVETTDANDDAIIAPHLCNITTIRFIAASKRLAKESKKENNESYEKVE